MPEPPREEARPTAAALFQRVWDELVVLIGTTAALVRRAAKRASPGTSETVPAVHRLGLEYSYEVPDAWKEARGDGREQLARFMRENFDPLCRELTGSVIARRLAQDPELVEAGLAGPEEGTR